MLTRFACVHPITGAPWAMDRSSGGYPYAATDMIGAELFETQEKAERWASVFRNSNQWPMIVVRLDFNYVATAVVPTDRGKHERI